MQKDTVLLLCDNEPSVDVFRADVLSGLRQTNKVLPCKYFYDEQGAQLFERICTLDEYYLTRTELAIMRSFGGEMAAQIGAHVMLVEYGSGNSVKTRILLDHLNDPVAYVPVDISYQHLKQTSLVLSAAYPQIQVLPICADFTEAFELPVSKRRSSHTSVYFPGSTIGNFDPEGVRRLLGCISESCGRGGGLLIGIDLQKDTRTLEAAYNDDLGVTAQFNLNLLARINRELYGDFDLDQFDHQAFYDSEHGRVEMHLVSKSDQTVNIGAESIEFRKNERVCTEYSHKYTITGFAKLAEDAGFSLRCEWTDEEQLFAVLYLDVVDGVRPGERRLDI